MACICRMNSSVLVRWFVALVGHLTQIGPATEPVTRPGQDDSVHFLVIRGCSQSVVELVDRLLSEGVVHIGAIERDRGDSSLAVESHVVIHSIRFTVGRDKITDYL